MKTILELPNLVLIGSAGRNSGKTFLATALIKQLLRVFGTDSVVALKITAASELSGKCPRGGTGCGACSLNEDFCLEEEIPATMGMAENKKDTALLLASGAKKVYWLRCLRSKLEKGYAAFADKIADITPPPFVICESNSLRTVIKPALFIMIMNNESKCDDSKPLDLCGQSRPAQTSMKKSALEVAHLADITLQKNFGEAEINHIIRRITLLFTHTATMR
ncbi:MAG: hypothetical protein Ta2B_25230 [Termitinemataceae bacterium]|nr:MAG: hypothetical protein Ta2B_25230 [Termitinemataceae bacterium]